MPYRYGAAAAHYHNRETDWVLSACIMLFAGAALQRLSGILS